MQNLPLACFCGFGHCACKRVAVLHSKPPQAQRPKPPHLDRLHLLPSGFAFTPPQHAALNGWRWGRGSAFPAFRKVGECQRWQSDRTASASGGVASGSIPRPALLSGARCGRCARCAACAAKRKKRTILFHLLFGQWQRSYRSAAINNFKFKIIEPCFSNAIKNCTKNNSRSIRRHI